MNDIQKFVSLDLEDAEEFKVDCERFGVRYRQEPNRGDPITLAIFLVMGTAVAVSAVQDALERRKGGQVVDLRGDAERPFYRSKDLAYGLLVLHTTDGTVSLSPLPGTSGLDQLTKTILSMRSELLNLTKDEAVKEIGGSLTKNDVIVLEGGAT